MIAAQNGHALIVELLLQKKANVDLYGLNKQTAFVLACFFGHADVAGVLLKASGKLTNEIFGMALYGACQKGNAVMVQFLLAQAGTYPSLDGHLNVGFTPLMIAAQNGYALIVDLLLQKKANVNYYDVNRQTALMTACYEGHVNIVQALLKAGAELGHELSHNVTAVDLALQMNHTEIVKLLREYKD